MVLMECNNRSVPLALNLVDQWAEGSSLTGKAIRVKLGTPGQDVLLFPAFTQDDVHVYNDTVQYVDRPLLPYDFEGLGVYDPSNSTTFSTTALSSWNGSTPNWDPSLYAVFNDALEVDGKLSLDGFPMFTAIAPEGYFLNNLPLSYISVFMKSLLSTGQILSRVIGYWPGTRSPGNDSSLVLGGYDSNRVENSNAFYTWNPPEDCYLCSNVTQLTFNGPNGTVDLFEGYEEASLQVVFEMAFPDIKLDTPIMNNLMRATGAAWNSTLGRLTYLSRPEGNITVTLQNNYTTTILNEEFFAPRPVLLENSTIGEDPNLFVALVGNGTLPGQPRLWGRPFLAMNYLIADWSRREIHLSPAVRERPTMYDYGMDLTPICEPPNTTANATAPAGTSSSTNTGAIAGGVVGGVIGLAILLAFGVWFIRRRRRAKVGGEDYAKPELADTGVPSGVVDARAKTELDSKPYTEIDSAVPQELDSAKPTELDSAAPQELDSDPRAEILSHGKTHDDAEHRAAGFGTHGEHAEILRDETSIQNTPVTPTRRPYGDD